MYKYSLVLTLGHGASVILIRDDGEIINGYQNERITRIKGDSQFPVQAIEELLKFDKILDNVDVYVSHWDPQADISKLAEKYWRPDLLVRLFPKYTLHSLGMHFTHHDAHAYSALAYIQKPKPNSFIIVADGFGSYGEVFTIYKIVNDIPIIIHRTFGYKYSLGLLYQYATDYCGMKMNRDEWKLNAMANQVEKDGQPPLDVIAREWAEEYTDGLHKVNYANAEDPMFELGALSKVHTDVADRLSIFAMEDKAKIAYVLQNTIEQVMKAIIKQFEIKRLIAVGGVFMNVQLNGALIPKLRTICVMPFSGDSGAGLGVYKYFNPDFVIPKDLSWGKRPEIGTKKHSAMMFTDDLPKKVDECLAEDMIVNVVRKTMEFGERAYCNTSTLALPSAINAKYINRLNDRDTCMPMCPVMTRSQAIELFKDTNKVIKSKEDMIIALEYKDPPVYMAGVVYRTAKGILTGRPQVVYIDFWLYDCLIKYGPLINTSFNNHGQPICYDFESILQAHKFMIENDIFDRVITIIEV